VTYEVTDKAITRVQIYDFQSGTARPDHVVYTMEPPSPSSKQIRAIGHPGGGVELLTIQEKYVTACISADDYVYISHGKRVDQQLR
jgi:hypothetical protein